ncbi:exonuclease domain-containing protein [Paenibacillus marinisediminis]
MLAIVYDLEMTVTRKKGQISEIIEIGAVKVTEEAGRPVIIDRFQAFVKPSLTPKLSRDTTAFTGITQQDVNQASGLQDVLDQFIAWIDTDEYALCSWGLDDKIQFIKECRMKKIPLHWLRNCNNLQKPISTLMGRTGNQQIGLKPALEALNIEFVGSQHRAIDDAYNTGLVYLHFADRIELQRNETSDHAEYESNLIYQDASDEDTDENNPFASLAMLRFNNPGNSLDR